MWHRFQADLQNAVQQAHSQCVHEEASHLTTRHLLIGMVAGNQGLAVTILQQLKASFTFPNPCTDTEVLPVSEVPTLSPAAQQAVEMAYREAVAWGESRIATEHLLFGLLRTPESTAYALLDSEGVTLQTATEALFVLQPDRPIIPEGAKLNRPGAQTINRWKAQANRQMYQIKRAGFALPQISHDPILLTFIARPLRLEYPHWFFRNLRNRGFYLSEIAGGWIASSYNDATFTLKDPAFSAARYDLQTIAGYILPPLLEREFNKMCGSMARQMLFLDAPEQTRLRALVSRQFTPRVVEGMRETVEKVSQELLDAVEAQGKMDVITDFAFPLPATVIARLLGVGDGDLEDFKQWSDDFVRFIGGQSNLEEELRAYLSLKRLVAYFQKAIAQARTAPKNDTLLSLFVHAQDTDGSRLTEVEIITNAMLLLAAGHETTTHLIGNGLRLLLRHPQARKYLQAHPEAMPNAVEEMLRFEPPVQWTSRVVRQPVTMNGVQLRKGEWVNVALAAANRDPERFPNPDVFDIHRADNKHLAFGSGPHFCLGAALARMEGEIALNTLLRRFPDLRFAESKAHWRPDFTFRAQTRLPVHLHRA
jgi:hypothetical protein